MALSVIPSDIDNLRALLATKGGLQRANRFEVYVEQPLFGFLEWPITGVSLPGRSLDSIPDELTAQGNNPRQIPIRRGYGGEPSVLLTMYVDQNWDVRDYFEGWMDLYNPVVGPDGLNQGPSEFQLSGDYDQLAKESNLFIYFLDLNDNIKWYMQLIEPYPTMIIQEAFSADMMNQQAMLNVSIGFKEYYTSQA